MKSTWTIGKKLWMLTLLFILNLGIVAGNAVWNLNGVINYLNQIADNELPAVRYMSLLDMMHDGIRANVFHGIIAANLKNSDMLEEVKLESAEYTKNIKEYIEKLKTLHFNDDIQKELDLDIPKVISYILAAEKVNRLSIELKNEEAMKELSNFNEQFLYLETALGILGDKIDKNSNEVIVKSHSYADSSIMICLIISLLGILMSLFSSKLIIDNLLRKIKNVSQNISEESKSVADSAESLNAAATDLSNSVSSQAAALQETAASVDEISAMVKKTGDNSKNLESMTIKSQNAANSGHQSIEQMLKAVNSIRESNLAITEQVQQGNTKLTEIVRLISDIGNKTKVINDIVFQTKLLSFNASVEAARAGEHGKGFAVVAEEVGNLAQMSGNAAKEISEMLTSSIDKVELIVSHSKSEIDHLMRTGKQALDFGSTVAEQCGSALNDIVKYSGEVCVLVSDITTAISEQNQGIIEISKAIQMLDQTTHQNSSTASQTSSTSQGLLDQSSNLKDIVSELEVLVGQKSLKKQHQTQIKQAQSLKPNSLKKTTVKSSRVLDLHGIPSSEDKRFEET